MLVYVVSIPGGMIADKVLGQKENGYVGAIILLLRPWYFSYRSILGILCTV